MFMEDIKEVHGYKAFFLDHTNRHGMEFVEGATYKTVGEVSFGNSSTSGFHMCKRLEDTLRYFPPKEINISIASVTGRGKIVEYEDDYYGFYDMYACEEITINRFLTREEILSMYLGENAPYDERIIRFVQLFNLNDFEVELFKDRFGDNYRIMQNIGYYCDRDEEAFTKNLCREKNVRKR